VTARRAVAVVLAFAVVILLALGTTGCVHNPCDGHGGTRVLVGGVFFCNDGTRF
jgi:hypothetical protein